MENLNREAILRMLSGKTGNSSSSGGGGDIDLAGYATSIWVTENFVSIDFFRELFRAYDSNSNEILPNDTTSVVASIKAMVGTWTEQYLTALGNQSGGGGGGGGAQYLNDLLDVQLTTPITDGQALVYNATLAKWVNGSAGVNMTTVWNALAGSTNEQINASHLYTALSGYVTTSDISDMATRTWVGQQGFATQTWVTSNFITIAYFDRLFRAYNNTTLVSHNDTTSTIDNIKAMFGFWTDFYLSALGTGGVSSVSISLSQLADVNVAGVTNGQVLTYDSNSLQWIPTTITGGGSGNYVTLDTAQTITALKTITSGLIVRGRVYGSGNDEGISIEYASNGWATLSLGSVSGDGASISAYASQTFWAYHDSNGNNYNIFHPKTQGTIALTHNTVYTEQYNTAQDNTWVRNNAINHPRSLTYNESSTEWAYINALNTTNRNYGAILRFGYGTNDKATIQIMGFHAGTWFEWVTVLTSANYTEYISQSGGLDNTKLPLTGGTLTGPLQVNALINANNYANNSNAASIVFDKPSSNHTGIGARGVVDTIFFCACDTYGTWVTSYYQKWEFNGDIIANRSVTALSDIRHKTIIKDAAVSVEDIARMPAVMYQWNDGREDKELHVGSIAQNWQTVLPEVVLRANDKEGTLSMQYGVAALVSSIIIARKVVNHEDRIKQLEKENKELKKRLNIA